MRKYIIIIICFFSIFTNGNAFFGGGNELDLFKNIDSGIDELENKMMIYEANGGLKKTGISKEINELGGINNLKKCLDDSKDISQSDFEKIALDGNISTLSNYMSSDCSKDGDMSNENIKNYISLFKKHYSNSKNTAQSKSDKIYNISKIGLFSDGIIENSGFDLITDIEDIDKIIFASKTDYYGEPDVDLGQSINGLLTSISEAGHNIMNLGTEAPIEKDLNKYKPYIYKPNILNNENQEYINETENNYVCSIDQSGLNKGNLNSIFTDINKIKNKKSITDNEKLEFHYPDYTLDTDSIYNDTSSRSDPNSIAGYSKVRDNSTWPCESFFCINIDFIMYQHNLFGGSDNMTVEYLLNRSNEHLSKFAASSLIPAKMSTNLFEIGLKDLNLPDIFHMAMQVSTKPIPLLRLEKQDKQDETQFASKNLLEKYYELNGLDYKRRNDLVLLKSNEQAKQSVLNSQEYTNINAVEKNEEYQQHLVNQKKGIKTIRKAIEKEVSYGVLDTFVEQYTELDKFTLSIYNYVEDIHTIIGKMREIPIDKG
ncbi:MAG: hypothetical protein PHS49_01655 [Candidatus Gracilibacteria bacterium]|nr:hypothetical protein [Candidatus Gracilibacteria bacterium]